MVAILMDDESAEVCGYGRMGLEQIPIGGMGFSTSVHKLLVGTSTLT